MASQAVVESLIDYYVNLLIIQYANKPKAQATIRLFAQILLANGIAFDVQQGYNIDASLGPTAVGKQLDVIGKYVGVDRFYSSIDLENFFSFITYNELTALPSSPPRFGFETYATFGENNLNGTLQYSDIVEQGNQLTDGNFLKLIQLAVILNNSNFSHQEIDENLFKFFDNTIRAESSGNMSMVFFISESITPLVSAILYKKLLPKPMGVSAVLVNNVEGLMFGMTDYSGYQSPFAYGFLTYSNYGTVSGQTLSYSQITEG